MTFWDVPWILGIVSVVLYFIYDSVRHHRTLRMTPRQNTMRGLRADSYHCVQCKRRRVRLYREAGDLDMILRCYPCASHLKNQQVPAVPVDKTMWGLTSIPAECYKEWEKLHA